MDPEKKISFGFNKLSKKPTTINKPEEKKVDYVLCLEGQSIKLKDEQKEVEKAPLVIPLKDNQKDLLDRVRDMKNKQKQSTTENNEPEDLRPDSELTIEELAAREVIREAKLKLAQNDPKTNKHVVVPMKKEEPPLEGEKESTLNDYENIPVGDFGLAMLRGMGWKEGMGIGKNQSKAATASKAPELRPKGLGLGASSMVNAENGKPAACDADGQTLILKKGCYAKIIAGNHKGNYCEVQGLDDEAGRIIIKTSLKGDILAVNEFMLVPVTKEEYAKSSKVINTAKFEEYKEMEERKMKTEIKSEKNDNYPTQTSTNYKNENTKVKKEYKNSSEDSGNEETSHSSVKVKEEKADNSKDYSKNADKESDKSTKKYLDSSSSDTDSNYERSRRHRRKDKRRHRDKSRSPYMTKYKSSRKSSKSKHKYRSSSSSDSDYERKSKSRHRKKSDSDDERHRRKNKK